MGALPSSRGFRKERYVHQPAPNWVHTVNVRPDYLRDHISIYSSGLKRINNNIVVRQNQESSKADIAIWNRGFSSGQHVFEIVFPVHVRCNCASIGVGTQSILVNARIGKASVVGRDKDSWAVDLTNRRTVHNGKSEAKYPDHERVLPDRFFMYIDLDEGSLQFGTPEEYFGAAYTDIRKDLGPLYPMVSTGFPGAIVGIVYRGKGKDIIGPIRKKRR